MVKDDPKQVKTGLSRLNRNQSQVTDVEQQASSNP